jgi:nucleoid DNA-binding protein
MGYKRKIKSISDLSAILAKKTGLDKKVAESVAHLYVDKIKNAVMDGTKVTLNELGSFELTQWKSGGIYDIKSATMVDRSIKTILFRASPVLKKKLAD